MDQQAGVMKRDRSREAKAAKFVTLAEQRVGKAMRQVQRIGNLSDRTNYDYEQAHVDRMFAGLQKVLDEARTRFQLSLTKRKPAQFKMFD